MIESIHLTNSQKQTLLNHAQKTSPKESCGILYGKIDEKKVEIQDIFLTQNIDESPTTRFTISNQELVTAYKKAENDNTQVVGIFHSHPESRAIPSHTDKKFMEINPVVWIIYSGVNKDFRAYITLEKDDDDDIQEVQIRMTA